MSAADPREMTEPAGPFERWWWCAAAWVLAAGELYPLSLTPLACGGFSLVYPALWITHRNARTASVASAVLGVGIAACLTGQIGLWPAALVAVLSTAGSISIGFWLTWIASLGERARSALADKEEALAATQRALDELERTQEALVAAERSAAANAERQRWAREVHDTLAQSFVSLIALSQVAASATGQEAADLHERMGAIAREGLGEARALIAGDGPPGMRDGLRDSLRRLCEAQSKHGGPVPVLSFLLTRDLSPQVEAAVLRVVQEALANVRRHARASWARVAVSIEDGRAPELVVKVEDDGAGIQGAPEGTGLTGMRERLNALGGGLTVDPARTSAPKGMTGTLLEARIPL